LNRSFAVFALLLSIAGFSPSLRAAALDAPPALTAMWDGKNGASVRAALLRVASAGEQAGASARQKMDSGEAAWWLGVQDDRAGHADSALFHWRRAVAMRGDFDEGFALIDALLRRARTADLDQAYALAQSFAMQAQTGVRSRLPEAQGRLAWTRHLRGNSDSALAGVQPWSDVLRRRPAWTRRLATIERAGGNDLQAWKSLTLLSARTRQMDASVESLVVKTQQALGYTDERRSITVEGLRAPVEDGERRFTTALNVGPETVRAKDGFTVRWFRVPAAAAPAGTPAPAPMLFVLSPDDSLVAADSLATAVAAAGHSVVFLPPRGSFGALGPGAYGPEAWAGRAPEFQATVTADAIRVMDFLAEHDLVPRGGWIVGAGGECAPIALAIARAREDTRAMLLVAPRLPLVEVAEYRARLLALRTRTFVQVSPEESDALELGDLLSSMTAPGQVRVADSGQRGRGMAMFRADPKVAKRLFDWLEESAAKH